MAENIGAEPVLKSFPWLASERALGQLPHVVADRSWRFHQSVRNARLGVHLAEERLVEQAVAEAGGMGKQMVNGDFTDSLHGPVGIAVLRRV